jgi:CTD small phosphatase-like protein 2
LNELRKEVKLPYLDPLPDGDDGIYTLVLDLDETLIHFESGSGSEEDYYMIRPGAHQFLQDLSCFYELVVFTAAMPDYANWIMDQIDETGIVKHRLYR